MRAGMVRRRRAPPAYHPVGADADSTTEDLARIYPELTARYDLTAENGWEIPIGVLRQLAAGRVVEDHEDDEPDTVRLITEAVFSADRASWQHHITPHELAAGHGGANGSLRQCSPKGTDLAAHDPEHLAAVAAELNGRHAKRSAGRPQPSARTNCSRPERRTTCGNDPWTPPCRRGPRAVLGQLTPSSPS
ncbi:hypothetical protein ACFWA9_27055 [Kitasatospora sp. NPDC059973]|uniref:hypothetical protein n=1 Tax=Kitasatospora sp. NPDC059973 TaxID=3347020 RepID=UPI0036B2D7F9